MSTPLTGPLVPLLQGALSLAERARQAGERRAAQWGAVLTSAAQAMCSRHQGQALQMDLDRSLFESDRNGRVTIVCHPCPICAADEGKRKAERRFLARGIPPRSLHITLETWEADWEVTYATSRAAAWREVNEWTQRQQCPFLIILGSQGGTGKTALGVAALRAFGADIRCLEFRDWIGKLGALDFSDRQPALESVRDYRALMIDDVGNRHVGAKDDAGGNNFERDCLAAVLNWRFEKRLPTIMTSNLNGEQFAGRLDSRTVDRIRAGRVFIDATHWPSRRAAQGI